MGCSVGVLGILLCCLFYYMIVGGLFVWVGFVFYIIGGVGY